MSTNATHPVDRSSFIVHRFPPPCLRAFVPSCLLLICLLASPAIAADYPTNRGSSARTGNIDNQPGPKFPTILWTFASTDHFIASPVPSDNSILISGLGTFNTAAFYALSTDPAPADRVLWKKSAPYLRQPMVCAPAVFSGKIIFGDGMHQTDGATLHCLQASTGRPLWQFPIPGNLVHLEGSPTIANNRVYIGGGNAGVLCIDPNRVTLEGKEMPLDAAQAIIDAKWKQLWAQYEADKKKDPDFAIPPSEDALPKPQPIKLWQVGQDKLHVDSSLAVADNNVLVSSAYLDLEKIGDRALYCLDANTGVTQWRTPLQLNPWAGPTVAGDVVLLGSSSIRFDPKDIPNGKGQLAAFDLTTGQIKWSKDLPGGVISPVAVADSLAICTGTDGLVRAFSLTDGQLKWSYKANAPFFAGPAVSADTVYVADLKAVVHALSLKTGQKLWSLDLAAAPTTAPGMVYGSPLIHQGRLYVATCNLETGQQKTVVVCIGQ